MSGPTDPATHRRTARRYPAIRTSGGYVDPRVRASGPGPGAGTERAPERSSMISARVAFAMTVLVGQLWALSAGLNAWMAGETGRAWWLVAFQGVSFGLILVAWLVRGTDR